MGDALRRVTHGDAAFAISQKLGLMRDIPDFVSPRVTNKNVSPGRTGSAFHTMFGLPADRPWSHTTRATRRLVRTWKLRL